VPVITDQPTCRTARMNKQYACAANSDCLDSHDGSGGYYQCACSGEGNPYVVGPGGCSSGSGKYLQRPSGDVALRDQFMNLHVHICVFFIYF